MSTYYIGSIFLRTRQAGGLFFYQNGMYYSYDSVFIFRKFDASEFAHCVTSGRNYPAGLIAAEIKIFNRKTKKDNYDSLYLVSRFL